MLLAGVLVAVVVLIGMLNLPGIFGGSSRPRPRPQPGPQTGGNDGGETPTRATGDLVMYCAAGLRVPVEEVVREYEAEYGLKVDLQYGGSDTLLSQLELNKFSDADLYLAADDSYTTRAQQKGLAAEAMPIAHMRPVIAVRKDRKKTIDSLDDLLAPGVAVAMAHPDQAAVGKATRELLQRIPLGDSTRWDQLERHVTEGGVFKGTVNDVATDVKIGSVDAGIVWDSTVAMPEYSKDLVAVRVPELGGDPTLVSLCVLKSSPAPTEALKFARYLTARDRGLPHFAKFGMLPVEGDVWAERPQITFFCGAVNRRAVDKLVEEFAAREGVEVNTVYNGCGILTGNMRTIANQDTKLGFPDVYMACDVYYLENVKEWFQEAANVSDTEIVIAVPKGSTVVKSLDDLVKPGVRVAIGQPEQCTIGALARRLLESEGLYDKLMEKQQQSGEVVVEKPSSALLVPDVVAGHVDAALAYVTDTLANKDSVDIVRIESKLSKAIQPLSIAKSSHHKYLLRRLFKKIAASPEAFEQAGFHFRLNESETPPAGATP
jgi:molybdenum ABC transporter molybdate-binding protein